MFWKNLPKWLKGGIIGCLIFLVLYLLFFISDLIGMFLFIFFYFITNWIGLYSHCSMETCSAFFSIIPVISLVEFFLLGAIVGFILEKISSK